MMDRRRRSWLAWFVIGAITPVALIGNAIGQDRAPRVIEVKIENRKVVAPEGAIRITEGEVVEMRWSSDESATLHLHGYDKELHVGPGKSASMSLTGRATGRFPITSHGWGHGGHGHHALTYFEVHPR